MTVLERVYKFYSDDYGFDASTLTPQTRLKEDLKQDSTDAYYDVYQFEEAYGISIKDESAVLTCHTIQDLVDLLKKWGAKDE